MIHWFYIALTWILGLGLPLGTIAVLVILFVPAVNVVAAPILSAVVTRFLACRACIAAAAFAIALVGSYWVGHYDASSDCKADKIAAQLATKNRDLENAQKAKDDETQRANKIEADANARQKDDADYIATLEGRPSCALDDSDLDGVRK